MPDNSIRVLKIGLIQEGQLIEDNVLREREGLSIGTERANTLSFNEPSLPKKHQLIENTPQGFKLNLLPKMTGRLFIDNQTVDISDLIAGGKLNKVGKGYELLLKPETKGKIALGDSTVLFQLVPPLAPLGPVKLPKEIRGGLMRNLDMIFLIMLAVSALAHTGMVAYFRSIPFNEEEVLNVEAEKFISTVKEEDIIVEKVEEEKGEEAKPGKKGGGGNKGEKTEVKVEQKGVLMLLSSAKGKGAVDDLLSNSGLGNKIGDALNSISGVKVGTAGDAGMGSTKGGAGGPGSGSGSEIGGLGSVGSGGTTGTGDRDAKKITAKLQTTGGGVTGKIDAEKVRGYIRNQLGGVRNCYEMQLKTDPNLQGKVKVIFSIGGTGDVASCAVSENTMSNSLVGDCVCRRVQRWRFPPPEEGTVTVSYTFIFTPAE